MRSVRSRWILLMGGWILGIAQGAGTWAQEVGGEGAAGWPGLPQSSQRLQTVEHWAYALGYDDRFEQAAWTQHMLCRATCGYRAAERKDDFRVDPKVRSGSAGPRDYSGSGYDRGHLAPAADFAPFIPRAPAKPVEGQVIGLYGDGLSAGQNQIVSLNRGLRDGLEKGHVLALWRAGRTVVDRTDPARATLQLPDEKRGQLFVFRVFDRVSYALILDTLEPVSSGDRFSQP